jgi:hypothetical protein
MATAKRFGLDIGNEKHVGEEKKTEAQNIYDSNSVHRSENITIR